MSNEIFDTLHNSPFEAIINNGPFPIRFPDLSALEQDQEWCEVLIDDKWTKIRFHDYAEVYKVPGLYETLFYRTLMCNSPNRVTALLADVLTELNQSASKLRVLDVGAGNGMQGEALQGLGVRDIVGVDILPDAKQAAMRDRPWVYECYMVADLTNLDHEQIDFLSSYRFNALTVVAALGFGDIPPLAFFKAYQFISTGGLIAFNIREHFLKTGNKSAFSKLIQYMINQEIIEIELYKRYQHRLNIAGSPLYYVAIVAKKLRHLSEEEVRQI